MCSINLAYLVRRVELLAEDFPSLDELLSAGLAARHEFVRMNQALRLARGVQCDVDWDSADRLVAEQHCVSALEELQRSERIGKLKKSIANPDLQFFVALLLNVPDRAAILDWLLALAGEMNNVGNPAKT